MGDLKACTSTEALEARDETEEETEEANLKRSVTIKVVSPKQKRRVNDSLTERIRRLSISSNLEKQGRERQDNESLENN